MDTCKIHAKDTSLTLRKKLWQFGKRLLFLKIQ